MLVDVLECIRENKIDQKGLNELLLIKDEIFNQIKKYEENKYTEESLSLEINMNPSHSCFYSWNCEYLIELCMVIFTREDTDDKLRLQCVTDIRTARDKLHKGLYEDESEAVLKYMEIQHKKRFKKSICHKERKVACQEDIEKMKTAFYKEIEKY